MQDIASILGLITKYEILEGEQIITDRLYREDERIGLVASVPRDMRAVTVPVDEVVGVAGFVKPETGLIYRYSKGLAKPAM